MCNLLVSVAFTFLCLGAVLVHTHPTDLDVGRQDTKQYLKEFIHKFNQQQEQDQVKKKIIYTAII